MNREELINIMVAVASEYDDEWDIHQVMQAVADVIVPKIESSYEARVVEALLKIAKGRNLGEGTIDMIKAIEAIKALRGEK